MARLPTQGGACAVVTPLLRGGELTAGTRAGCVVVLPAGELPDGARSAVDAFGTTIALFNVGGAIYALENRCAHHGGPLCHGRVTGLLVPSEPGEYRLDAERPVVVCPWHGWEYDLASGRTVFDPAVFVRAFEARIEGADVVLYERAPT